MTPRRLFVALALLGLMLVAVPAAPADARLRVGIGDQKPETFSDSNFRKLRVKRTRYICLLYTSDAADE